MIVRLLREAIGKPCYTPPAREAAEPIESLSPALMGSGGRLDASSVAFGPVERPAGAMLKKKR